MSRMTNAIATALATWLSGVSTCRGASAVPLDTIPGTPYGFVSGPKGQVVMGSLEWRPYRFVLHYLVSRTRKAASDQTALNDALDDLLDHIATQPLGLGVSGVIADVVAFDTERFYKVGATDYQSIDLDVDVTAYYGRSYSG